MIEKYATNKRLALEIGSYQGVSAARIAKAISSDGVLFCVDPWDPVNGKTNPCYAMFRRHIDRAGVSSKIRPLHMLSTEAADSIPNGVDFIFVDGDHSWSGIQADWSLVGQKLVPGGIVCLHDSVVPPAEPWREPDSVRFFSEIIRADHRFELVYSVHSLAVVRRVSAPATGQTNSL